MNDTLSHHGIKGQKWGVRRYQNADGTWTTAGKKRYGDDNDSSGESGEGQKSNAKKKAAIGVATGVAAVAGVVLTAYLVKKVGSKNISEIADQAEAGKDTVKKIMETTSLKSTPVSQLSTSKVAVQKAAVQKAASTYSAKVNAITPKYDIPNNYNFETLRSQNSDLLKKMYEDLLS